MEKNVHMVILYDIYNELLTDSQKQYFEEYYFNNLSLAEISENLDVSRNAVHKQIKVIEKKLEDFENVLKLYSKSIKLEKIIKKIDNKEIKKELEELL